ncbi:WDR54 protein, partial [Polypterus senegalus]|nr:WDR54 protein [Polypterus senegalus]
MYRKEKSIQIKSSASALYSNLSVLPIPEKSLTYFTVVHGNVLNMVSASGDGLNFSHRQLQSKEGSITASSSLIMQMYESDGSIMVYWHALDIPETPSAQAVFARGIAAARGNFICVGTSSGSLLVFDVPSKGTNITLSEVLEEHREPITDIASEVSSNKEYIADLVSTDDSGLLCVWKAGEDFKLLNKIPAYGCTCSSVMLWTGIVVAGYSSGQIRLYDALSGVMYAEVNAHARWIYALDIASDSGKLLSGAEDSLVRIWKLSKSTETNTAEIEHLHTECVTDIQICGAKFCDGEGSAFAVTGYDLSEIIRYTQI